MLSTKLLPRAATRATAALRPARQTRSVGAWKGKSSGDPNDLGGPGGQELFPYSNTIHRRYFIITSLGVATCGAIMYYAKKHETINGDIKMPAGAAAALKPVTASAANATSAAATTAKSAVKPAAPVNRAEKPSVLVSDNTKGELDNVKVLRPSEVAAARG